MGHAQAVDSHGSHGVTWQEGRTGEVIRVSKGFEGGGKEFVVVAVFLMNWKMKCTVIEKVRAEGMFLLWKM